MAAPRADDRERLFGGLTPTGSVGRMLSGHDGCDVEHVPVGPRNRNAQLFFAGMLASSIGTWVQFTAVAIIVDRLTGKTTAIGILSALQFGPMLLLGRGPVRFPTVSTVAR